MKNHRNYLVILSLTFILISCRTGRIDSLDREPDEAIIFAKIEVKNFDDEITQKSSFVFCSTGYSSRVVPWWSKLAIRPDEEGYIYMKLPVGTYSIQRVNIREKSIVFPEYATRITLPDGNIYYIGDITMAFENPSSFITSNSIISRSIVPRSFRNVYKALNEDDEKLPEMSITNNINSIKYFREIFPTNDSIFTSLFEYVFQNKDTTAVKKSKWD
ncbi:MAG: hypothetical protein HW421_1892 [Ignavibacteria bacterium]|nr:hypothetical protein [Ignavibacteria bacterium]